MDQSQLGGAVALIWLHFECNQILNETLRWRTIFVSITSKVVCSSSLDLNRDGCSDSGGLVSVHRQHGVVLQDVQVDTVPLAIVKTRTCTTHRT